MAQTKNVLDNPDQAGKPATNPPGKYDSAIITENGKEILCPLSDTADAGLGVDDADINMTRIKSMIRSEISQVAQRNELESFEDANDFDVDDDFDQEFADSPYMEQEFEFKEPLISEQIDEVPPAHEIDPPSSVQEGSSDSVGTENSSGN